jgi:hypothetical protein
MGTTQRAEVGALSAIERLDIGGQHRADRYAQAGGRVVAGGGQVARLELRGTTG